jgi:hypothetical protein
MTVHPEIYTELWARLSGSYTEQGFEAWLDRPRVALFGQSPRTALERGWTSEVLELADRIQNGVS